MRRTLTALTVSATIATLCGLSQAGTYRTITPDGDLSDWAGITPSATDISTASSGVDFTNVYIANDSQYLYFRFDLATANDPTSWHSNYYINTDGNAATGFQPTYGNIGSELLIEGATVYQQAGGGFNEGALQNTPVLVGDYSFNGTTGWEYAIPLNTQFEYGAAAGQSIFTSNNISLMLTDDLSGDSSGIVNYTIASAPEPASLGLLAMAAIPLMRRRRA